jgi:hypothetical protein
MIYLTAIVPPGSECVHEDREDREDREEDAKA